MLQKAIPPQWLSPIPPYTLQCPSGLGYGGGYDAVRRCAREWNQGVEQKTRRIDGRSLRSADLCPGGSLPVDGSHAAVLLSGVTLIVKAAHVRLCHRRMLCVRAYPRETQEMAFDARDRAFALFKGARQRGICANININININMKMAVETIFASKQRLYNRRFLLM